MLADLRSEFLLDPDVVYLNHGSFGACPRPVFERYQELQLELERQPVDFIVNRLTPMLGEARAVLAAFLGTSAGNLVFVPNATFGVNVIARSLPLGPGDEILTTDHEYGACDNIWTYLGERTGARYIRRPVDLPIPSAEVFLEAFWDGVTDRTRIIYLSHITSPTAIILPLHALCIRARDAGILTVIDGAHAPGQIPLDLDDLGADFYTGNCHKWLMSPKGAGFLYAHPRVQDRVEPLVIGWGQTKQPGIAAGSDFIDSQQWLGTDDLSAYLAVPAAIAFQESRDWPAVRNQCHDLLAEALAAVDELTGLDTLYSDPAFFGQMGAAALPVLSDPAAFKQSLYESHRVEIPVSDWRGRSLLRISIQGYNTAQDIDRLIDAMTLNLPLQQ